MNVFRIVHSSEIGEMCVCYEHIQRIVMGMTRKYGFVIVKNFPQRKITTEILCPNDRTESLFEWCLASLNAHVRGRLVGSGQIKMIIVIDRC